MTTIGNDRYENYNYNCLLESKGEQGRRGEGIERAWGSTTKVFF